MPNLTAYVAVPAFILVTTATAHRDRIPWRCWFHRCLLAHTTGGVVVVTFVAAWWLFEARAAGGRGRGRDFATLAAVAVPAMVVLLPWKFLGVLKATGIIAGHAFVTHEGARCSTLSSTTGHLNDFSIQNILIALAGAGFLLLLIKRVWWPAAVWLLLVVAIVHSSAPFGGHPIGTLTGVYSDLYYSDPRASRCKIPCC